MKIFIMVLGIIGCSFAIPVSEEESKRTQTVSKHKDKLRQDEDDGIGEIEQVGELTSQIISGVLSGNFNQIFGGSVGFIEDADTETGVNTILTSVAKPLNMLVVHGLHQGQKYYNQTYNITTAPPPTLKPPPPPPSQQQQVVAIPVNQYQYPLPENVQHPQLQPIVIHQQPQFPAEVYPVEAFPVPQIATAPVVSVVTATAAPVTQVVEVTIKDEDDGDDSDSEVETDATARKQ